MLKSSVDNQTDRIENLLVKKKRLQSFVDQMKLVMPTTSQGADLKAIGVDQQGNNAATPKFTEVAETNKGDVDMDEIGNENKNPEKRKTQSQVAETDN